MDSRREGQLGISHELPFKVWLVPPPPGLADLVNTFFAIRTEERVIDEILPAYSAQMVVFATGSAALKPANGKENRTSAVCFSAPLLEATPVTFDGPAEIFGASLTALGWQALSGLPVDDVNTRIIPGEDVIGSEAAGKLHAMAQGEEPTAIFEQMGEIIEASRATLKPSHARFAATAMAWLASDLNPPIATLYDESALSKRTVQRLTRRFFGVSPARVVKRFRAIRAAMLLANPDLPQPMRDAVIDAYFDQAHMIRDIRRYTGRTPSRLGDGKIVEDTLDPDAHGQAAKILRNRTT